MLSTLNFDLLIFPSSIIIKFTMRRRRSMKKALFAAIPILTAFALASIQTACQKPPTADEVKSYFELMKIETKWTKKFYRSWPPKLILVPAISFQVKNITEKPLRHINFNAIFRQIGDRENLGDCYFPGIRGKPLLPGETSSAFFLKSNFGVEGKSLDHIRTSPDWKTVMVKLFAQSKGSRYILLGEWEVSRSIDFKEPEPLTPEVKKEEKIPSP